MVMEKKHKIAAAGVVVVLLLAYFLFAESDESKIRNRLNGLAAIVEKSADEKLVGALAKYGEIKNAFTENCSIDVGYGLKGDFLAADLAKQILQTRGMVKELSVKFYDFNITIEGQRATVIFTARISGTTNMAGKVDETQEVKSILEKDGEWRISFVSENKVLEK